MQQVRTSPGQDASPSRAAALVAAPLAAALLMGLLVVFAETQALVVAVSLIAFVFILIDFRFGVACLIVLMPLSASTMFPHSMGGITGLNPINLLLLGTAASLMAHGLPGGGWRRFVPPRIVWCYFLPIVAAGLIGMRHVNQIPIEFAMADLISFGDAAGYVRDILLKPLLLPVFALLVGAAAARSRRPEDFLIAMIVSVWVMSLLTLLYFYRSGASLAMAASTTERGFLSPLGLHANDLGRYYTAAYALMLFTAAATRSYHLKVVLAASMALVVLALTLTFSRSAFFGFLLVSAIFLVMQRRFTVILLGAALLAALAWVAPPAVYERIGMGWGEGLNAVSAGRVEEIWLPLLPETLKSPIWGNGLASTLWSEATRTGRIPLAGHPHNAYLAALLDMGLLGLGLLAAYWAHVWAGLQRLRGDTHLSRTQRGFFTGALVALATFLVAGLTGSTLTPAPEQFYLWFAIGMMYGQIDRPAMEATA